MRKTVFKAYAEWNYEKEEKWLNEMADKGWKLVKVGFCKYVFEPCEPGEYTIRLQALEDSYKSKKGRNYIEFVEETGAEFIDGLSIAAYFCKKRSEGEFELFSDNASRIKHINNILSTLSVVGCANLCVGIANLVNIPGLKFTMVF